MRKEFSLIHKSEIKNFGSALLLTNDSEDFRLGVMALARGCGVKLEIQPRETLGLPSKVLMHHLCKEQSRE